MIRNLQLISQRSSHSPIHLAGYCYCCNFVARSTSQRWATLLRVSLFRFLNFCFVLGACHCIRDARDRKWLLRFCKMRRMTTRIKPCVCDSRLFCTGWRMNHEQCTQNAFRTFCTYVHLETFFISTHMFFISILYILYFAMNVTRYTRNCEFLLICASDLFFNCVSMHHSFTKAVTMMTVFEIKSIYTNQTYQKINASEKYRKKSECTFRRNGRGYERNGFHSPSCSVS